MPPWHCTEQGKRLGQVVVTWCFTPSQPLRLYQGEGLGQKARGSVRSKWKKTGQDFSGYNACGKRAWHKKSECTVDSTHSGKLNCLVTVTQFCCHGECYIPWTHCDLLCVMSVTSHEHTVIYSVSWWVLHPMNILSSILCQDECDISWTHCDPFYVMMSVTSHEHTVIYSVSWWMLHSMNTLRSILCHHECYIPWTHWDLFYVIMSVTFHEHTEI